MKTYPSCIGGVDDTSDWCNRECTCMDECLKRLVECIAPPQAKEVCMVLYCRERVKAFAWECRVKK